MKRVTAVILGGGRGTRLSPLTKERSKPAVPLAGKYRLIDIPVSNCINSGIRKIYVLTQFNSASLNAHIANAYRFDLFSRGFVEILAAEQTESSGTWFQGTADAVRQSYVHLADEPTDYYLILSGDHLYRMDYMDFLNKHIAANACASIAVQPVSAADAPELGILQTDTSGKIIGFVEKPKGEVLDGLKTDTGALGLSASEAARRPYLGSMGIYIFNAKMMHEVLFGDTKVVDFGKEIIPAIIGDNHVQAYMFDDYWADIGTVRAYFEANLDLCRPLPRFNLFEPDRPIYTNTRFLPPAKALGGLIEHCIVSEGSIIEGGIIKNSVLGVRSRVGRDVNLCDVVMLGADYYEPERLPGDTTPRIGIGEGTVVRRAILDKNARIGTGVRLVNQEGVQDFEDPEERFVVREGIIVVPKNAIIPDGFVF